MGPGTRVKSLVGEFHFKRITNPAFVGIFDCQRKNFPDRLVMSRKEIEIRRSISVTSFLGDCFDYPMNSIAEDIMGEQHLDFFKCFVNSIPQDALWLVADCGLYSHITLKILAMLAKQSGKYVNAIAMQPLKLYGPRVASNFEASWGEMKKYCDSSVVIDTPIDDNTVSIAEQKGFDNLLEKVEMLEHLASNFEYYVY